MKPSLCLREVFGGGRRWNAECALQVFDEMTLWRWKVMSSTSTTMSLGNPVVQNLQRRDFEASFGELVHCFQMGLRQKNQNGKVFKLNLTIQLTMLGLWSLISQLPPSRRWSMKETNGRGKVLTSVHWNNHETEGIKGRLMGMEEWKKLGGCDIPW